eukprot:14031273-Alexandrium_andersonii.AAC.1
MCIRDRPCPPSLLLRPAQREFGSWNPGVSGVSGRSPSAFPAQGGSPSAAGGWATTRGIRGRPMFGVAMSPRTS